MNIPTALTRKKFNHVTVAYIFGITDLPRTCMLAT